MLLFLFTCLGLSMAEPDSDHALVVEAHRDLEVYVAPVQIRNEAPEIEAVVGDYSVFGFASMHSNLSRYSNGQGGYESIKRAFPKGFMVYNEDTIKYAWGEECNYSRDAKKCSYENNHFLLETHVTIDRHQLVVEMFLYNSDLQIVSRGSTTSNLKTAWIKQQEVTSETEIYPGQSQRSCNQTDGNCSVLPAQPTQMTTVSKPREEMPLKWDIPHKLLNYHIQQASLRLWTGARIDAKD